jgi:hypothetical protein
LSRQPVEAVVFWRCVFGAATLLIVCALGHLKWRISQTQLIFATVSGFALVATGFAYSPPILGVDFGRDSHLQHPTFMLAALEPCLPTKADRHNVAWLGGVH